MDVIYKKDPIKDYPLVTEQNDSGQVTSVNVSNVHPHVTADFHQEWVASVATAWNKSSTFSVSRYPPENGDF